MERDYGKEIDLLNAEISSMKNELQELMESIKSFCRARRSRLNQNPERVYQMMNMHPDKRLSEKMEELCALADKKDVTGLITYLGVYSSGGRQSNWIRNEVCTDDLLALIEDRTAEKF